MQSTARSKAVDMVLSRGSARASKARASMRTSCDGVCPVKQLMLSEAQSLLEWKQRKAAIGEAELSGDFGRPRRTRVDHLGRRGELPQTEAGRGETEGDTVLVSAGCAISCTCGSR